MKGKSLAYRPEIDGLRAFALITILLFHTRVPGLPGGFLSVDIFFVISGFLITALVLRDLDRDSFSLKEFWLRRARRILPGLVAILLATVIPAWLILFPEQLRSYGIDLTASLAFVANFRYWLSADYFSPDAKFEPLIHLWTLAVEEQFYLFFPLVLLAIWKWAPRMLFPAFIAAFVLSFGVACLISPTRSEMAFYLLPTRAWELAAGAAVAWWIHNKAPQWSRRTREIGTGSGLLAILVCFVLVHEAMPHPGPVTLPVILGSAAIILFGDARDRVAGLLAARPLVGIGLISYSGYLWHQPLFAFYESLTVISPTPVENAIIIGLTLSLAYVSWRWVEEPMRNRERVSGPIFAGFVIGGLLALGAIGITLARSDGYPERFSERQVQLAEMGMSRDQRKECSVDPMDAEALQIVERCHRPGRTLYLIGDSHGQALAPALGELAKERGLTLISLTPSGCFPLPGVGPSRKERCGEMYELTDTMLEGYPAPVIVTARWRFHLTGARYDNGEGGVESGPQLNRQAPLDRFPGNHARAERALLRISEKAPLIVLNQIPEAGWNVPLMMARREGATGSADGPLSTSHARYRALNAENLAMFERLGARPGINVVQTDRIVCAGRTGRCLNELDGKPLYVDDDHPSHEFARMVGQSALDTVVAEGLIESR